MSWQSYQTIRFRRARSKRYQNNWKGLGFPYDPGLVSVLLQANGGDQDHLGISISRLLDQTYANIEIIVSTDGIDDPEELFSHLPRQAKDKIKLYSITKEDKELGAPCPYPKGEFIAWLLPNHRLQPDCIEEMVSVLHQKPQVDLVYYGQEESASPLANFFLTRSQISWILGENSRPNCSPRCFPYWWIASLLLDLKTIDLSISDHSNPQNLLDQLTAGASERDYIQGDFCRDLFLSPWICYLQETRLGSRSSKILSDLKNEIVKSGNLLYQEMNWSPGEYPQLWIPTVYLLASEDPGVDFFIPPGLPQSALKVLLNLSPKKTPESVNLEWDLCLNIGGAPEEHHLIQRPFTGWICSKGFMPLLDLLDIRVHANCCWKTLSAGDYQEKSGLKTTAVISTYRREEALRNALRSIAQQTFPQETFEVIVVNNDPQDERVDAVCKQVRSEGFGLYPQHLRLIQCPLPGLSNARNAGISEALGEIIAFIDDDALAQEDWLDQIWQAFLEHPQTGVIGGHITLDYPEPRPKVLKEGLERFWGQWITGFEKYTEVQDTQEFPWGGNWCARRNVLLEIGGFRGLYGKQRRDFSGGEEIIAAIQARRLGYSVAILPSAVVQHRPDSSRYTLKYLNKTITSQIIVHYRMQRDLYLPKLISMTSNMKGIGRFSKNILGLIHLPSKERRALLLEYICYINAWFRLFLEQLGDAIARYLHRE